MNPLTSFFRLFDFRKTIIIDIIKAENEEEADRIFKKKWGNGIDKNDK